jgi:hypothetical protein
MTATNLKLTETTVSATAIRMRLADEAGSEASAWIEFQVPLAGLELPRNPTDLGDPNTRLLAEVRLAALRAARDAIGVETQRLSDLVDRKR